MKAIYFEEHGGPETLHFGDVADPVPAPEEVVVRVRACALNHLDIWVRRGWPGLTLPKPHWCGADVAGEIAAIGSAVRNWKIGQPVVVDPGIRTREDEFTRRGEDSLSPGYHVLGEYHRGGAAEMVAVPAANLVEMPESWDFPQAAAPLLVTLTAWRMLIHRAALRVGETALIVGAGGGVNSMALQMVRLAGARAVVVAGNAEKARRAAALGADEVVDRSRVKNWSREVLKITGGRGVDVVVDNVGRETLAMSMKAAVRGGRIVIVGNTSGALAEIDVRYIFGKQLALIGSTMGSRQDFRDVLQLIWSGRLRPVIDRVVPLSEGIQAYRALENGEMFGKIVLTP